jgi:2-amino-4-hydroxy-6-hydroxymethyldihydropteridine diphosphokinase
MKYGYTVFLVLGSNTGNPALNLRKCCEFLEKISISTPLLSSVYQSPAWGLTSQADFLNQAVQIETLLTPERLLFYIKGIEVHCGRIPGPKWGPRTADIDIIFYENQIVNSSRLCIPHPHLKERAFVLYPLAEIGPDFRDPLTGMTIFELSHKMKLSSEGETCKKIPIEASSEKN